ncbi:YdeI/OmpD-associated family protein [Echinicola sp. CAU 1574]|uniref:YdeI/OmpD-associated family protein n=1 Tax=Echinicola arenosa TaxID=2774144 RepID=A0ABR9APA7_9BACT|nr:YdeI/OmpD-associated family protein [Echinicola arenosa]MBD8490620.1 YdeI/OmpD-associated family protein [Echinicola arenosa]
MNTKVDLFLEKAQKWQNEMKLMRKIALDCGLTEDFKWMHPCYTLKGNNVVLIHEFKEYCAFLFHKGALLKDPENILIQQTKNVQSARQIRFTHIDDIVKQQTTIKAYIYEAIEIEKAGLVVEMKKTTEFDVPEELEDKFKETPSFKTAFEALTPGRQRGYLLHFSQAKQAKTRISRIEKAMPDIFEGKGLNDR